MNTSQSPNSTMLFIGNGFDKAVGHKTGYSDFYRSIIFETLKKKGNDICNNITCPSETTKWSDLEYGLWMYSKELTRKEGVGNKNASDKFKKEYDELKKALFDYLNHVQEEDTPFTGKQNLLLLWKSLSPFIVTFNYTRNLPVELIDSTCINNKEKLIPIHGTIDNTDMRRMNSIDDIVLGIDESQKVEDLHSFLYKSHQNRGDINQLQQLIEGHINYIIQGCSMGMSDATYFRMLFDKRQSEKRFLIYGKDDKSVREIQENMHDYIENWDAFHKQNAIIYLSLDNVSCMQETVKFIDKILHNK